MARGFLCFPLGGMCGLRQQGCPELSLQSYPENLLTLQFLALCCWNKNTLRKIKLNTVGLWSVGAKRTQIHEGNLVRKALCVLVGLLV